MANEAGFISLLKESALAFVDDDALSRGASIAFYVVTSLVPVLIIIISIAGAVYGEDAARGAIAAQLSSVMGTEGAELMQSTIRGAAGTSGLASAIGIITLLVTSSGVFGEMRSALNAIWRQPPQRSTLFRFLRGRIASLGMVAILGFMLLLSLTAGAVLAVPGAWIDAHFPFGKALLWSMNFGISFILDALLFAAIYKIMPDTDLQWKDVVVGALATAVLFGIGKFLIGLYIRSSAITTTYGAAGGLVALLLWIYYSAQIFLFGAEFTKAYACRKGSQQDRRDALAAQASQRVPSETYGG